MFPIIPYLTQDRSYRKITHISRHKKMFCQGLRAAKLERVAAHPSAAGMPLPPSLKDHVKGVFFRVRLVRGAPILANWGINLR